MTAAIDSPIANAQIDFNVMATTKLQQQHPRSMACQRTAREFTMYLRLYKNGTFKSVIATQTTPFAQFACSI